MSSGAETAAAVRFARYPPLGERGVGHGRAGGYGRSLDEYLGRANEQLVVAVQVETRAALDRLDEILAVAGVDVAFFFGPGDLALSLGVPLGGEEVYEAVESGFARAPSRRVAPLAPTRTAPSTRRTGSRVARTCSPSAPTSRSSPPGSSRLAVGSRS